MHNVFVFPLAVPHDVWVMALVFVPALRRALLLLFILRLHCFQQCVWVCVVVCVCFCVYKCIKVFLVFLLCQIGLFKLNIFSALHLTHVVDVAEFFIKKGNPEGPLRYCLIAQILHRQAIDLYTFIRLSASHLIIICAYKNAAKMSCK